MVLLPDMRAEALQSIDLLRRGSVRLVQKVQKRGGGEADSITRA